MPLLDHFHPPTKYRLPWESIHSAWMVYLTSRLNDRLPEGYYALEHAHVGPSVEIDVATFGEEGVGPHDADGSGVGVAAPRAVYIAPTPAATVPAAFAEDFEVRVISDRSGRHLAAAIELVGPANKNRPDTRRQFAGKCASYLAQGVAVVVVDVVTERAADLHAEIMAMLGQSGAAPVPGGSPLYAAAYRPVERAGAAVLDVWHEPLAVGQPLPTLPLWLRGGLCLPVELQAAYDRTCREQRVPTAA